MTGQDRHADRLYVRLAGGAELTPDDNRHVATCADCQRAVADAERFDRDLHDAAAGLATEQIPEADLPPTAPPERNWTVPIVIAAAAGVIALALGFAVGGIGRPAATDATPSATGSPVAIASETPTPAPTPSVTGDPSAEAEPSETPEPSAGPTTEATPRPAPLATGGETCADGVAGFRLVVPDGWHANLRQDDLMACSFLAAEPFDPALDRDDPSQAPPIQLTAVIEPEPEGDSAEPPAEETGPWLVHRGGESWSVYVVELFSTIEDEPAWLHLAARADDADAVAALEGIVAGLTVTDPIFVDESAVTDAEDLFADADACADLVRGIGVILPDPWWVNTAIDDLEPCTYVAPEFFEIADVDTVPDEVPITLELGPGPGAPVEEEDAFETLVVDGNRATRQELPDASAYFYVIQLTDDPDGEHLVAEVSADRSLDYELDRAVLDEMMRRLVISPTPVEVLELDPLPTCGWELVERTAEGDVYDPDVRECFWADYEAGSPSEMISFGPTVEGALIRTVFRVLDEEEVEVIVDATHDPLATAGWTLMRCTSLERGPEVAGEAVQFGPGSCDEPIDLEAP
jgi:hypothetical protein